MPQPTVSDVHIDAALTNISVAYVQNTANFIATQVFPAVPVDKKSDKYFVYEKGDWFRDEAQVRAAASESAGGGYELGTDSYLAEVYAFHKDVDYDSRANADAGIDMDRDATNFVTGRMLIKRERMFAAKYMASGVWGTDLDGSDIGYWNDDANGDPITTISEAKLQIQGTTGYEPNTLVLGPRVYNALKKHPLIVDRFKYTSASSITIAMLAQLFEVDKVLVAKAVFNSAKEGQADQMGFVHGDNALLVYSNPTPGLMQPSGGYIFNWSGMNTLNNMGVQIRNLPMPLKKADRIEGEFAFDMKLVASDLGIFFSGMIGE